MWPPGPFSSGNRGIGGPQTRLLQVASTLPSRPAKPKAIAPSRIPLCPRGDSQGRLMASCTGRLSPMRTDSFDCHKRLVNLLHRVVFVEQTQPPLAELRGSFFVAIQHLGRTPELFQQVPQIDQTMDRTPILDSSNSAPSRFHGPAPPSHRRTTNGLGQRRKDASIIAKRCAQATIDVPPAASIYRRV